MGEGEALMKHTIHRLYCTFKGDNCMKRRGTGLVTFEYTFQKVEGMNKVVICQRQSTLGNSALRGRKRQCKRPELVVYLARSSSNQEDGGAAVE
jgi:hypothetical protein